MPFLKLAWITSWVSLLMNSGVGILNLAMVRNHSEVFAATASMSSQSLEALPSKNQQISQRNTVLKAQTGLSNFATRATQGWRQAMTWQNTVQASTCVPKSTADGTLPTIIPTAYHQPATLPAFNDAGTNKPVSKQIHQVFKNLAKTPEPAAAYPVTSTSLVRVSTPHASSQSSRRRSFRFLNSVQQLRQYRSKTGFQVWVNGHLIAQVPKRKQAEQLTQELREALDHQGINPEAIKPAFQGDQLMGIAEDQVLFTVDQDLWKDYRDDLQLLAIKWVNNLRVALNAAPLSLVEAQQEIFELVETEQRIGGLASWYGPYFHGRLTANGEIYDQYALTAAHPSLPLGTFLQVTNLENQNSVVVRVNDRGPYIPPRSLDLSLGAARCLDSEEDGVVQYEAVILSEG
jgi:rare lipoprotein A